MAQKTQMVTISLEEYKELLLKDKVQGNEDSQMMERLMFNIEENLKYTDSEYYSNYVGDNMNIKDENKVIAEFMKMLKYVNLDRYMKIWNKVMSVHRQEEEQKLKIKQMNEAKEIRQESKDK